MSDIKTWIERCDEHPDHQSGMISDGMIRARMCEEIADLRAEIERLLQAIGLVTTTVSDMEIDIENPVGMAQRVVAEVERLRAENERLCNEDTKTRHALGGWVWVCPDGGDEPTHERVAAVVAEVERLREALRWYSDLSNHLPVERRNPGDPDPSIIILDEPPILLDGGTLARIALEGKP